VTRRTPSREGTRLSAQSGAPYSAAASVWRIRPAVPADAAGLCRLNEAVALEGLYIVPDRLFFSIDQQQAVLADRDPEWQEIWVAVVGGDVVGELEVVRGIWPKNRHTATLAMVVAADWRRHGIGTALMTAVEGWARPLRVEKLCLSVFETNEGALALYRRLGYQEEGRRPDQFRFQGRRVAEVLMAKFLG